MDDKYRSRKFALAVSTQLTAIIGLFTGYVDQGSFIALTSLTLGLYGAANVMDKRQ